MSRICIAVNLVKYLTHPSSALYTPVPERFVQLHLYQRSYNHLSYPDHDTGEKRCFKFYALIAVNCLTTNRKRGLRFTFRAYKTLSYQHMFLKV